MQDKDIVKEFASKLSPIERQIAVEYINLPNSPDIQPEMMKLYSEYGNNLKSVSDKVEELRKKMNCDYEYVQLLLGDELRKNIK